jgi:protein-S-isoprenylcysteine O-methyltransferase Ste14
MTDNRNQITNDKSDHAPVVAPPPLLMLFCILAGFVARYFEPLPLFSDNQSFRKYLATTLFVLAFMTFAAAILQFVRNKTHPSPYKPSAAVIVAGIYRITRNPIYIAFLLIVVGFAVAANSAWFLLSAIILFLLLHFGVVKPEERYLAAKFGSTYDEYRRRVRRWI